MMEDIGEEAAAEVQPQIESAQRENGVTDVPKSTALLTEGLLATYQPLLEEVRKELAELNRRQESMCDQIEAEHQKLGGTEDAVMNEVFSMLKTYQGKLGTIKKDMSNIHERVFKLKKRALRLEQIKQKEALNKEHQREQEIRREQELIGKQSSLS